MQKLGKLFVGCFCFFLLKKCCHDTKNHIDFICTEGEYSSMQKIFHAAMTQPGAQRYLCCTCVSSVASGMTLAIKSINCPSVLSYGATL